MQAAGRGRSPFRLRRNTRAKPVSPACGGRGCAPSPRSAETLPYIQYSSHIFLPATCQNAFGNRLFTPPQSGTQCPPQRKSPGTQWGATFWSASGWSQWPKTPPAPPPASGCSATGYQSSNHRPAAPQWPPRALPRQSARRKPAADRKRRFPHSGCRGTSAGRWKQ